MIRLNKLFFVLTLILFVNSAFSQNEDEQVITDSVPEHVKLFNEAK